MDKANAPKMYLCKFRREEIMPSTQNDYGGSNINSKDIDFNQGMSNFRVLTKK